MERMRLIRLVPSGEKPFLIADALDLLNLPHLERQLVREMRWQREGKTLQELSDYLDDRGVTVSVPWLCKFYQATRSYGTRVPAA